MKPTKNFKLSSTTKTLMVSITDNAARNAFKRGMIQAQLASEQKITEKK